MFSRHGRPTIPTVSRRCLMELPFTTDLVPGPQSESLMLVPRARLFSSATRLLPVLAVATLFGCARHSSEADSHAAHDMAPSALSSSAGAAVSDVSLPAGAATVAGRLAKSPRHGEYVM